MKHKVLIAILCLLACHVTDGFSQEKRKSRKDGRDTVAIVQDTVKKEEIDIYKEFSLTSFADEDPQKQIDSSKLSYHLIGIKAGYSMPTVTFSADIVTGKSLKTFQNFGIYYTYYHSLWERMPYFGFQLGVEYCELGFANIVEEKDDGKVVSSNETKYSFQAVEVPLLSQFRVDFWRMRLMLGIGPYGYYIFSDMPDGEDYDKYLKANRYGAGIMGGGGIAFIANRLEFHVDCYFRYALSHFYNPKLYSEEHWIYTHSNQLALNFGIFFRIGGGKKWER